MLRFDLDGVGGGHYWKQPFGDFLKMNESKANSPLVGYNTNIKHKGKLFHIQTEDSGIEHPHIITHLFAEGTILATKKTSYADLIKEGYSEKQIRQLMKDQHKAMFIELRDGVYGEKTDRILKEPVEEALRESKAPKQLGRKSNAPPRTASRPPPKVKTASKPASKPEPVVRVILPAPMKARSNTSKTPKKGRRVARKRSVFTTPESDSGFGEDLISDKSLDELILSYVNDELEE